MVHWVDTHFGAREISVIGHSMGGKVAMELALRRPERVANLAVVDISPVPYSGTLMHTAIIDKMAGMDLGALKSAGEAREAMKAVVPDAVTREFVLTNLVSDPQSKGYKWKVNIEALRSGLLSGALAGFDRAEDCKPFHGPCLWLKGGNSAYVQPDAHSSHMRELFPSFDLHTLTNCGHWPHAENPEVRGLHVRACARETGRGKGKRVSCMLVVVFVVSPRCRLTTQLSSSSNSLTHHAWLGDRSSCVSSTSGLRPSRGGYRLHDLGRRIYGLGFRV